MPQTIQIKRGLSTSSAWPSLALLAGEPAFLTDTGKLYVGDGSTKVLINPTYGTAANANTGTASGNVPVLDAGGKLASSVLPSLAIKETFVVTSQSEMLALVAQTGDVAIRTDINTTFILQSEPAATLANWVQVLSPTAAPVLSVNSLTGAVVLTGANVNMTGYTIAGTSSAILPADSINAAMGKLEKADTLKANLASPTFTGTVNAPTPTTTDNSTVVATTAFVKAQGYVTASSAPVTSVNTKTGAVVLAPADMVMTGYTIGATGTAIAVTDTLGAAIGKLEKADTLKAPLASPTFTGTVVAPTPATSDNSTTVATTAYVKAQNYLTSAPVTSVNTKTGAVVLTSPDILMTGYTIGSSAAAIAATDTTSAAIGKLEFGKAPLASPTFTGTPAAPTATVGTNTTQIASTAFVQTAISVIDGGTF